VKGYVGNEEMNEKKQHVKKNLNKKNKKKKENTQRTLILLTPAFTFVCVFNF
jgi:hypothetical protein